VLHAVRIPTYLFFLKGAKVHDHVAHHALLDHLANTGVVGKICQLAALTELQTPNRGICFIQRSYSALAMGTDSGCT
jgi:hypothetical protein